MNPCSSNPTTEKVTCDLHLPSSATANIQKPLDQCSGKGSFTKCHEAGLKSGTVDSSFAAKIRKETFDSALKSFKKELKKLDLTK